MFDYPIPSNNSIIIFSATNAAEGIEGGRVRQNISFSAETAISISGGLNNDFARIEPNGNTFTAVAKTNYAYGSTTFNVTVTTAGDADKNLTGITVSFTFRVLVLGSDVPHIVQGFFEFRVGESVGQSLNIWFAAQQAQLNIPKSSTMITSLTEGETDTEIGDHDVSYTIWNGAPSGIYLTPQLDSQNYVRGASLTGVAQRPGIYFYEFEISSYDNGGGIYAFPGANGYALLIINIYDDRESPKISMPLRYEPNKDFIRIIDHSLGDDYVYARLRGAFTKSDDMWIREVREQIADQVSDVWQYRMVRSDDGKWTLSGRNYLSDQSAPDYQTIATTADRFGTTPPNNGWSGGVLCAGDGNKFVPGYGFFDLKGTYTTDELTSNVYEQQAIVSAQYEGWSNPPRLKYNSGLYLMKNQEGKWYIKNNADADFSTGIVVKPKLISNVAVPYMPATAGETFLGNHYRDVALNVGGVPVNAHLDGSLHIKTTDYPAAVLPHYTFLRQAVPPNNATEGESVPVSYEKIVSTKVRMHSKGRSESQSSLDGVYRTKNATDTDETSDENTTYKFSNSLPANVITRLNEKILSYAIGSIYGTSAQSEFTFEYNRDKSTIRTVTDVNNSTSYVHTDTLNRAQTSVIDDNGKQNGIVLVALASGRDQDDDSVYGYSAAFVDADVVNLVYTIMEDGSDYIGTVTSTGQSSVIVDDKWTDKAIATKTISFGLNMVSPAAFATKVGKPIVGGYEVETMTAKMEPYKDSNNNTYKEGEFTQITKRVGSTLVGEQIYHWTTFTAEHEHTCYSGENVPPGLIDRGTTHIKKIIEQNDTATEIEEEWVSDPRGEYFKSLQTTYGQPIDDFEVSLAEDEMARSTTKYTSFKEQSTIIRTRIGGKPNN